MARGNTTPRANKASRLTLPRVVKIHDVSEIELDADFDAEPLAYFGTTPYGASVRVSSMHELEG